MDTLLSIANRFASAVTEITPLGNGLINDTYLIATQSSSFVLQRLNRKVFPMPEQIMANLAMLNRHVAQKSSLSIKLQIPEIIKTIDNDSFYLDQNGDCWRALSFIANTESIETIGMIGDVEQAGFALGHFHRLISGLDPLLLHNTLPGFHVTPEYLKHYYQVLQQPTKPQSRYCSDFITRYQFIADDLEAARKKGLLTLRVIHGDPKLNNFLFDKCTHNIVSIIDLDTVMPGLVHYDIGDCVRSCCSTSEQGGFDLDICAALLTSYLSEAEGFFTQQDYLYIYPAIRLIPFELGIRFYTDYLEGNRYFKVTESEQNLHRAVTQFRLCASIIAQESAIRRLISQLQSNSNIG